MNKKVNRFMALARQVSYQSGHRCRIGAVLVKGRKNVINVGFNKEFKSNPRYTKYPTQRLHAEGAALLGIDRSLTEGATMYVYRERRNISKELGTSKPCSTCQGILKEAGLAKVYFTDGESASIKVMKL